MTDPREILASSKMSAIQIAAVAITIGLNALDGFDVLAISFASPGIARDWRMVFEFGAAATALFIPLVWWLVPESIAWLCQRQPAGSLGSVNRSLARMGIAPVDALPILSTEARKRSVADIFSPHLVRVTVLATLAYFLHITTFYFILKWVPKIVVDMGFTPSSAAGVLVWANVGGASGGAVLGLLSMRYGLKHLTTAG